MDTRKFLSHWASLVKSTNEKWKEFRTPQKLLCKKGNSDRGHPETWDNWRSFRGWDWIQIQSARNLPLWRIFVFQQDSEPSVKLKLHRNGFKTMLMSWRGWVTVQFSIQSRISSWTWKRLFTLHLHATWQSLSSAAELRILLMNPAVLFVLCNALSHLVCTQETKPSCFPLSLVLLSLLLQNHYQFWNISSISWVKSQSGKYFHILLETTPSSLTDNSLLMCFSYLH